jgi:GNAT superfamily N-acetyltransferase
VVVTRELAVILERAEAHAWGDFYLAADEATAARLGVGVVDLPGARVTVAPAIDVLAFNRALGIGLDVPLDEGALDRALSIFCEAGVARALVQVAPDVLDARTAALLDSRGLTVHNHWVRLWRETTEVPDVRSDLEIVEVGRERALEFGRVVASVFDWPADAAQLIAGPVGRSGWLHYAALDRDRIVATGATCVAGESAWLDFASTLPEARGRGAQSALLARRIRDAASLGCQRVLVETSEPRPDNPAQSWRNVKRMGFVQAYVRPNYVWRAT